MHPGSTNDVAVNADERKNTTSLCLFVLFSFFCSNNENALKFLLLETPQKQREHKNTKYEREHVHVQNDANTYTHFYAHPYTCKRIIHTRDCNLIALNTSHNGHLPLTYSFLLCASLLLLLCVETFKRFSSTRLTTTNDIEREKDTNERRNMNEDDLRAFDDEDAFAIRMDYEKYDENEFPSLLLGPNEETNIIGKEQQQQQQQ